MEEQVKEPQLLDQSNRVLWHRACNWTFDFSLVLKERRFLSIQTTHIKQPGTIFQMSKENFPSQKLQQDTKLSTEPSMTHWIPIPVTFVPTTSELQLQDSVGEDDPQEDPEADGPIP